MGSSIDKRFLVIIPIIVVIALGLSLSIPATAEECASNNCEEISFNNEKYRLKGESLEAYRDLINQEMPHKSMKLHSQYLNSTIPFLIGVDGEPSEVDKIEKEYNMDTIISEDFPNNPNHKQIRGYILKSDLTRLINSYPPQIQEEKSISISHIKYLGNNLGTFEQVRFLNMEQTEEIKTNLLDFKNENIQKIIDEKAGVSIVTKK